MDSPTSSCEITFSLHPSTEIALPFHANKIERWLHAVSVKYQKPVQQLDYIFCSDDFLLSLNRQYLDHDYLTDILTFPYDYSPIIGEVYISLDRAQENSAELDIPFGDEVLRLVAHGFLHMAGYRDGTEEEKKTMRSEEDHCIALFSQHE